jgi:hypothetical protein
MLTKIKVALAATLLLGTASVALANPDDSDVGGYPVQTWQDIQHDQQDIQNQIQRQYHTGANADGYASQRTSHAR